MSQELSPEQKLLACVLACTSPNTCALQRVLGFGPGDMLAAAVSLGFTAAEGWGIMHGWDYARGRRGDQVFADNLTMHTRGFDVGQRMWHAARAAGVA